MRRREEDKKTSRRYCVLIGALLLMVALLLINETITHATRLEEMKKRHAVEMARCLEDWQAGLNGGCDYEEITAIFEGEPMTVDVEVIARPLD